MSFRNSEENEKITHEDFGVVNSWDELEIKLHASTFNNVRNALVYASEYFDVKYATELTEDDIMYGCEVVWVDESHISNEAEIVFGSCALCSVRRGGIVVEKCLCHLTPCTVIGTDK